MISKQSIRKDHTIYLNEKIIEKSEMIEISKEFHTVILSDVPIINSDDEARRFISFIDECYDRRVKLIISAAELPEKIYVKSRLEEKFKRTISRLTEMQSKEYLSQAHLA